MVVVFCPRCGSTDAGEGDSSSVLPTLFQMVCSHCGHTAIVDDYEIRFDWNTRVAKGPLPRFVAPVERLYEAVSALRDEACSGSDSTGSDNGGEIGALDQKAWAVGTRAAAAWAEPHRHYHTRQHLAECLRLLDDPAVRAAVTRPNEVEVAIWLHDLVYDTHRSDNEAQSAEQARALLEAVGGIDEQVIARVTALILATKDHVARTSDEAALLDLDLAILAAPPARFAEYEAQIREEYGWVADEAYRSGRSAVLATFALRPRIYVTELLHERLDAQARANLARLTAGPRRS